MQVGSGPMLNLLPAQPLQGDTQLPAQGFCPATHLVLYKLATVVQLHILLPWGCIPSGQRQAAQCV